MPYTTFLLLLEFAAGCMAVLLLAQLKGEVSKGFLKMGAILIPVTAIPALWTTAAFGGATEIADYPLAGDWRLPPRLTLAALGRIEPHGAGLRSHVGQTMVWQGRLLVPLYHPSPRAGLSRSYAEQDEDFRRLGKIVRGRT